jgi:hemerythrin superfamily protein
MKKSNGRRQDAAPTASIRMTKPIAMLKDDHKKVTDLFDKFERANDARTQWEVARKAIHELKIHSAIEEELFYPSVGKIVRDEDLMNEAAEEHHVVHVLMDEINGEELEAPVFHAKFMVLAESVRHHIKQEEGQMFTKLASYDTDLEELGAWMEERRQELDHQFQHALVGRPERLLAADNRANVTAMNRLRPVR